MIDMEDNRKFDEFDYEKLAECITRSMQSQLPCNIRTTAITSEEHEADHELSKHWVRPMLSDMRGIGRKAILFGAFFVAFLGVVVMLFMAWVLKAGIAPFALKFGMAIDPSAFLAWCRNDNKA